MKCMNHCLWYISLKLGAYLVCSVFLLTSITICIFVSARIITGAYIFPATLKVLVAILGVGHGLLFIATCVLLYGLCMEKLWPLIAFLPITLIVALDEVLIIAYIIIERNALPDEAVTIAAGQSFLLVAVLYSGVVIFSLYLQWRRDILEGRPPHSTNED